MFGKTLRSRLEKLVILVNEVDEKSYNIHDLEFHEQLLEGYAERDQEIFGEYTFKDWLDYLIEKYEIYKEA